MKALIVDFTGVIADGRQFFEKRAKRVADLLGAEPTHDFLDLWKHYFTKLTAGQISKEEYYKALGDSVGVSPRGNIDEWFAQEEQLAHEQVPDELIAIKRKLGLDFKMAVLANYPESWMVTFLEKHNLKRHFKAVVASDTIKARVPNPKAFEKAAVELGKDTKDCVYLSDEAHNLKGARDAGMIAVFMPGQETDSAGFPRIKELQEVERYL